MPARFSNGQPCVRPNAILAALSHRLNVAPLLLRLVFVLLCALLARPQSAAAQVEIADTGVNLQKFAMGFFIDKNASVNPSGSRLSFEQVQHMPFTPSGNKLSLGTGAKTTWSKIELNNISNQDQRLFLHHPYAYHNRLVALYEVTNGQLDQQQILDLDTAHDSPLMYRGNAVFEFSLAAGAQKTLYVQSVSFSHQWFSLLLLDEDHSRRELIGTHNDIALMVGILLALVIYNFLLYFSSSKRENFFYSLYLVSGGTWIALSYGFLANMFSLYGTEILPLHLSLITMPIFLILFMMDIFATSKRYPKEHRWLQFILLLLSIDLVYGLFDIVGALRHASSLAALMMLITISVSISLARKGDPLAKYFLFGHCLFVLFSAIAVLFYKGLIEFNYLTSHGVGIGIMLESLMLAFIISYRIKMLEDIKASQDELKLQAVTDPMTQLYNRRYFYTEAEYQLNLAREQDHPLSLMILDIDLFKQVNDSYGHQTGDAVIIQLAKTLQQHSRSGDLVARFGGEEFVLLLPATDQACALQLAEQIRQAVQAQPVKREKQAVQVTISIGLTQMDTRHDTIETALNLADIALYEAKNSGRNQVRVSELQLRHDQIEPL